MAFRASSPRRVPHNHGTYANATNMDVIRRLRFRCFWPAVSAFAISAFALVCNMRLVHHHFGQGASGVEARQQHITSEEAFHRYRQHLNLERCTADSSTLERLLPLGRGRWADAPLHALRSEHAPSAWRGVTLAVRSPFGCSYAPVRGLFLPHEAQVALLGHLMARVRLGQPFVWLRWADAEMIHCNTALFSRMVAAWQHTSEAFFVAVGSTPWLCQPQFQEAWNAQVAQAGNFTFVDAFYLVSGAPMATEDGLEGWLIASAGRPVVLVGPPHLAHLAFLNHSRFVELPPRAAFGVAEMPAVLERMRDASRAFPSACVLFVVAGGTMAKPLVTAAHLSDWGRKDSYIDIGSAFDGFVGRASRSYIDVKILCEFAAKARYVQPEWRQREWMSPGVCAAAGAAHCPTAFDQDRRCGDEESGPRT